LSYITQLVHDKVIDTSLLYPHSRGPEYKQALRNLVQQLLGRTIQEGEHDSVADAMAAMELVLLKIKHGKEFVPK
jgi:RNA exonuclease 1